MRILQCGVGVYNNPVICGYALPFLCYNFTMFFKKQALLYVSSFTLLFVSQFLFSSSTHAATETFNSSTTWVAPVGVTSVQVEAWGAGAGAYNGVSNRAGCCQAGRAGGGGGAYSKKNTVSVTPGNSYTVTVGAGGAGGASPANGGDTYFIDNTTVLAKGGVKANTPEPVFGGAGGSSASGVGDTKFSGGAGGDGADVSPGTASGAGGGSSAGTASNGVKGGNATAGTTPGSGATAPSGGGNGGTGSSGAGGASAGSAPGGGGGGGGATTTTAGNGAAGAAGRIVLTYTQTFSITGTVYSDEGTTNIGTGKTVAVSINGAAASGTADTDSNGAYSITGLAMVAGDVLTLYIDGETEKAVTVTVSTGANMTGINLYQNDLITRCDNSSCSLTNANLETAETNADADIASIYSVASSNLTLASGKSLFIPSSHTFAPGGNITLSGNFTNNGTYTKGTETITLTATSSGKTIKTSGSQLYALTLNGSGGVYTPSDATTVSNNLTITAGTLTLAGSAFTVTGTTSVTGTINTATSSTGTKTFTGAVTVNSGGTFDMSNQNPVVAFGAGITQSSSTAINLGSGSSTLVGNIAGAGTGGITYGGNLTISSGTTTNSYTGGTLTIAGTLTLTGNFAQANGSSLTLSGTTPFAGSGTFSASTATNTVTYSASGAQTVKDPTAGTTHTYSNLALSGSGAKTMTGITTTNNFSMAGSATTTGNVLTTIAGTLTLSGTSQMTTGANLVVTGDITIGSGTTLDVSASNYSISVAGNWSNAGTFTPRSGTVTLTSTSSGATLTSGGSSFYSLTQNGSGGTYTLQDALITTNNLTITAGTLDTKSGSNYGVSVGGTWSRSGTFTPRSGTLTLTGTSTFADTMSFYAVTINGSGQTVTLGAALTTTSTLTVTAGTLTTSGSNYAITVPHVSIGASGTLTANASTITLNGTSGTLFTNNGIFTAGTSTITVTPDAAITVLSGTFTGSSAFYNLTFSPTITDDRTYSIGAAFATNGDFTSNPSDDESGWVLTLNMGGAVTVAPTKSLTMAGSQFGASTTLDTTGSNYAITAGAIVLYNGSGALIANASVITLTGTTSGALLGGGGTFTQGTSEVVVTSASGTPTLLGVYAKTFHKLTINSTATVVSSGPAAVTINNASGAALTLTAGVFNIDGTFTGPGSGNGTLTISSGATLCLGGTTTSTTATCDSGPTQSSSSDMPTFQTYSFNSASTVTYLADAAQTISVTPTYGNLKFTPKLTSARTYTFGSGTATINGDFTPTPNGGGSARVLTITMAGAINLPATKTLTLSGTSSGVTSMNTVSGSNYALSIGLLTIASGSTLTANASAITVGDNYSNAGTFTAGTSTVTFNKSSGTQTLNSGSSSFYNLTHSGAGTLQLITNALTVSNNFTNSGGTFDANGLALNIAGNFDNNGGIYTANNNTVTLNGTNQSVLGSTTFYNLTKSVSSAATLTFEAAKTFVVSSALTLQGAANNLLSVISSIASTQFSINIPSSFTLSFLNVKDVNNTNATSRAISNSQNSGNNTNVTFSATTVTWTGTTSTNYGVASNWDVGYVPNVTDNIVIPDVTNDPILDTNRTMNNLTINSGGLLSLNDNNLTLTGTFSNDGTLKLLGSETLTGFTNDTDSGTILYVGTSTYTGLKAGNSYYNLTFNGTGGAWTLNSALTVNGNLSVTAGTLDVSSSNYGVTVGGNFTNAGTFTARSGTVTLTSTSGSAILTSGGASFYNLTQNGSGGTYTLQDALAITNNLNISAGTLDVSTNNYAVTVGGNFTNAGTFTARSGTVTLTSTSSGATLTSGGSSFYNLIQNGSGGTYTLQDALATSRNLTVTSGTLDVHSSGNYGITVGSVFSNSGTFTAQQGTVTLTCSSGCGITQGASSFYNLAISASSSTFNLSSVITTTNNFSIGVTTHVDVSVNNHSISVGGNFTNAGGFNARSGTITFTKASGTQTLTSGGTGADNDFTNITKSNGGTLQFVTNGVDIDGTLTIDSGTTVDLNGQNLSSLATLINNGTLLLQGGETVDITTKDTDSGLVKYNGSGSYTTSLAYGNTYYDAEFAGTGVWEPSAAVTTNRNLIITSGTFDIDGQNLTITGTFSNSGTLRLLGTETVSLTPDTDSGTISYDNSSALTDFPNPFNDTYYSLTLAGNGVVTLANDLTTNGNLTVSSGATLALNDFDVTVAGNLVNSGTLTHDADSTITLNGTTQTFSPSNTTINAPISISGSSGTTSLGSNFTVGNIISIAAGKTLALASYIMQLGTSLLTNLGIISENGGGYIAGTSSNLYIADSNFDADDGISLGVESVYISLIDQDANLNGGSADTLSGVVVSCATDSETVTLTETGAATETFRNAGLTTALYAGSNTNNNGTLTCADAAVITATYTDPQDGSDTRSDTATATSDLPAAAPSSFSGVVASSTSITWSWTDNASNETGFKLYNSSNTLIATIATPNTTSYTETGLTKGVSYTRKIVAYNNAGNSTYSNSATVLTPAEPQAPSNFTGVAASNTSITWSWNDNSSDETGFKLLDGNGTLIATITTANTTTYTETGLTKNTSYTRKIAAYNDDGTSAPTSAVTVSTSNASPTAPVLISPSNNALSSTGLPTFSFKKSTEVGGTISSYTLYVGGVSISGIPASGSTASNPASATDYQNTYTAQYFSEGDSDATNDYIVVTLKDGSTSLPLPDGIYVWYVKAIDTEGNSAISEDRTISIDATKPSVTNISLTSSTKKTATTFTTETTTPTLTATLSDSRGLQEATITLSKATTLLGTVSSYTALETRTYPLTGKSQPISFIPKKELVKGQSYKYTITVTDTAGNETTSSVTLSVLSAKQAAEVAVQELNAETTPTNEIVEALRGLLPESPLNLTQLQEQAVVRRQLQSENFQKFFNPIIAYFVNGSGLFQRTLVAWVTSVGDFFNTQATRLAAFFNHYYHIALNMGRSVIAYVGNSLHSLGTLDPTPKLRAAGTYIATLFTHGQDTRVRQGLANRQKIDGVLTRVLGPVRSGGAQLALKARATYEVWFDNTPTKISNLAMTNLSPTSVTVTWDTNHLTHLGKVNFGTTTSYGEEMFEADGLRDHHEVTLENLSPATTYYFEVMNQNGGYVYDAYYAVTTPAEEVLQQSPLIPQDAVIQGETSVPVYREPTPEAEVVKTLLPGATLRALTQKDGWVSVLLSSGQQVWIQLEHVNLIDHEGTSASAQH